MSASDEPRESPYCKHCQYVHANCMCDVAAEHDNLINALTPQNVPILAAILAEVARQEADEKAFGPLVQTALAWAIFHAAHDLREAIRLRTEGA
jgi:hypothetical protein